ncbi:MAG: sulfatase/phosphatase domain-containing protein, partial [Coraliomargarita sp.]
VEAGIRTPIFITHANTIPARRETETLASNIDIATTILHACGITPPELMRGLDLRDPQALAKRDRVFVDVYQHDSNLDQLDDLDSGLDARVVIDGWDKLIARLDRKELYDLKTDPDDRRNIAAQNPEKVQKLSTILEAWLKATPSMVKK